MLFQLALHAAALWLLVISPQKWGMALATVVASQLMLMAAGLWPRSTCLGANLVRLPAAAVQRGEVAVTIDDGPDPEVTPQVLAILAQHGVHATFFCIGTRAAAHPELCHCIVAAGHRIENHGARHPTLLSLSGPPGWRREISEGQQILQRITGQTPRFYRAVAGLRNPFLAPVLHHAGLQLTSWTRRGFDTRERDPEKVLQRLTHSLTAGDILLLHDGNTARTSVGEAVIVSVLPKLLEAIRSRGLTPITLNDALPVK
ncbi:polysaccharide deacetylase family protein [Simplicispira psychrophila]|uniref:polysaccharide deacetylase family protein n=1 Tax=Simplicispira psychrophila TaxID=80882 RepID=UPI001FE01615|nr:polysaccharide deacetylase family protein [Simplicispira psychrophila]